MEKPEKLKHPFLYSKWIGGGAIDCIYEKIIIELYYKKHE